MPNFIISHRIILDCTPTAYNRLQLLKERVGAKDEVEVIQWALALYDLLTNETSWGAKLVMVHSDGEAQEVVIKPHSSESK